MYFPDKVNVLVQTLTRGERQMRQEHQFSFYVTSCPQHTSISKGRAGVGRVARVDSHSWCFFAVTTYFTCT